eukprot:sb/3461076/
MRMAHLERSRYYRLKTIISQKHPHTTKILKAKIIASEDEDEGDDLVINPFDTLTHSARNSQFVQYKKTLTLDLDFGEEASTNEGGIITIGTDGNAVIEDKKKLNVPNPGKVGTPKALKKLSSPTFRKRGDLEIENVEPGSPVFGQSAEVLETCSSPTFQKGEEPGSPVFGQSAEILETCSSPTFQKREEPGSPVFGQSAEVLETCSSPTFQKGEDPEIENVAPGSPVFGESVSLHVPQVTEIKCKSPIACETSQVFDQTGVLASNENIGSPTFDQPHISQPNTTSPTFGGPTPATFKNKFIPISKQPVVNNLSVLAKPSVMNGIELETKSQNTNMATIPQVKQNNLVTMATETQVKQNNLVTMATETHVKQNNLVTMATETQVKQNNLVTMATEKHVNQNNLVTPLNNQASVTLCHNPNLVTIRNKEAENGYKNAAAAQNPVVLSNQTYKLVSFSEQPNQKEVILLNQQQPPVYILSPTKHNQPILFVSQPQKQPVILESQEVPVLVNSQPLTILSPTKSIAASPTVIYIPNQTFSQVRRGHQNILPQPLRSSAECTNVYSTAPMISTGQPVMLAPVKLISPLKMNNGFTKVTVPEGNATSQEKMERPAVQKRRAVNMPNSKHPFPCFWKNCTGWFERSVSLAEHLMTVHFRDSDNSCQWLKNQAPPSLKGEDPEIENVAPGSPVFGESVSLRVPQVTEIKCKSPIACETSPVFDQTGVLASNENIGSPTFDQPHISQPNTTSPTFGGPTPATFKNKFIPISKQPVVNNLSVLAKPSVMNGFETKSQDTNMATIPQVKQNNMVTMGTETRVKQNNLVTMATETRVKQNNLVTMATETRVKQNNLVTMATETRVKQNNLVTMATETRVKQNNLVTMATETRVKQNNLVTMATEKHVNQNNLVTPLNNQASVTLCHNPNLVTIRNKEAENGYKNAVSVQNPVVLSNQTYKLVSFSEQPNQKEVILLNQQQPPVYILSPTKHNQPILFVSQPQKQPVILESQEVPVLVNSQPLTILSPTKSIAASPTVIYIPNQNFSQVRRGHQNILPQPLRSSAECTNVYSTAPMISTGQPVMLAPVKLISPLKMNNGFTKVTVPEGDATSQNIIERPAVQKRRIINMPNTKHPFPCFWKNCTGWFERSVSLAEHLMTVHFRDSDHTSCQWLTCDESPGTRSKSSLEFHLKNVHAKAPKMTSLPKRPLCTLDVQNAFSKVEPETESGESSLTSSLHILVTLILRNFLYYTPALRPGETPRTQVLAPPLNKGRVFQEILQLHVIHWTDLHPVYFMRLQICPSLLESTREVCLPTGSGSN